MNEQTGTVSGGTEDPGTGTERPGSVSEKPGSVSEKPGSVSEKPGSVSGTGSRSGSGSATGTEKAELFDHEKLDVYRVAREFLVIANEIDLRKMPRDFRDQLDRASVSILANIGEGGGKTSRQDKQRYYEIARGSANETATLLDIMRVRGTISAEQHARARKPLFRVSQMLSRLVADPRRTR